MRYYKKLLGEKVYLSPMNVGDAETFVKWLNDFNVTDYTGKSASLMTLAQEEAWVRSIVEGNNYAFSIIKNEDDSLIGNMGLHKVDHINRSATLGILIGEHDNRSKGYGTEAISLLLDFAFNYLNLNSVNLTVLEVNERAKRCYEKVGFKEFGRQRKCKFVNGKYYDIVHMDILKEEFKQSYIKNKNV